MRAGRIIGLVVVGCGPTNAVPRVDASTDVMESVDGLAQTSICDPPSMPGLDPTYQNGFQLLVISGSDRQLRGHTVDRQGRLLLAGACAPIYSDVNPPPSTWCLLRIGVFGALEMNVAGATYTSTANAVGVDEKDRIVLGGAISPNQPLIVRLNADGSLDATFNAAGTMPGTFVYPSALGEVSAIALDGNAIDVFGTPDKGRFMFRVLEDGSLDQSYPPYQGPEAGIVAGVALADGFVVLAKDGTIEKRMKSGALDPTFKSGLAFPQSVHASVLIRNGDVFFAASADNPSMIIAVGQTGQRIGAFGDGGVSDSFPVGVQSLGIACNRLIAAGGSTVELMGLDGHRVVGDAPIHSGQPSKVATVQVDGRVVTAFSSSTAYEGLVLARIIP